MIDFRRPQFASLRPQRSSESASSSTPSTIESKVPGVGAGPTIRPGVEISTPKEEPKEPAVSIRKSVTPGYLICLEDGKHFKALKRHLTAHGLTPEQYRAKWKLSSDYPVVAANYAASWSAIAKAIGLGQLGGNVGARKRGRLPKAVQV